MLFREQLSSLASNFSRFYEHNWAMPISKYRENFFMSAPVISIFKKGWQCFSLTTGDSNLHPYSNVFLLRLWTVSSMQFCRGPWKWPARPSAYSASYSAPRRAPLHEDVMAWMIMANYLLQQFFCLSNFKQNWLKKSLLVFQHERQRSELRHPPLTHQHIV